MKHFLTLLLLVTLALGAFSASAQDATAPEGTFLGTWPYLLPPDHTMNGFVVTGGLNTNLGVVYRSLVEMPPAYLMWSTGEYQPLLAESWGFTEDNCAYEITLNADAMWSNGEPVTSDDVLATYALGRIMRWAQFDYIDEIETVDEKTVRFNFIDCQPSLLAERLLLKDYIVYGGTYADLVTRANELVASGATSDSEEWAAFRTELETFRPEEVVASGPYTYTMDDVNDAYMTLRWQPNSIFSDDVQFGEIRLWAGETEATTPLVLSGELAHSTNVYPASTIEAFQAQGIRTVTLPRGYGAALLFNHDVAPFNVKEVRQAIAHAIEREENAFLTNGIGARATVYMSGLLDEMVPLFMNQEDIDALNRYEYDVDRAAELMETAGFTRNADGKWADADGNTISVEYTFPAEFADFSGAAQNAIDQLNEFGFDITPRALPWQEAAAAIRAGDFDLSVWSWANGSPFATRHFYNPTQRFNYVDLADGQPGMNFPMEFEWNGETVNLDQMIDEVSGGIDLEEQRVRAGQVALIINDVMPFIPLNVEYSVEPLNEELVSGAPADDDPILQNPSGSGDHFLIWTILNGSIGPTDVTRNYAG